MLFKLRLNSSCNLHCDNTNHSYSCYPFPFTFPMTKQYKGLASQSDLTTLTYNTHHCFLSWWASPQSCSAPTGQNAPQTWSLLDYFLRSKCQLSIWVTAELAWAGLSWSGSLQSSRHQYWARPGQRAPGYQGRGRLSSVTSNITNQYIGYSVYYSYLSFPLNKADVRELVLGFIGQGLGKNYSEVRHNCSGCRLISVYKCK